MKSIKLDYSNLSKKLTTQLDKKEKKDNGIFFTPPDTIDMNLKLLKPYFKDFKNILEPSCGSCEYIFQLKKQFANQNINITGVELNSTIFDSIKKYNSNDITLLNKDFIKYEFSNKYDLIIGNPPYFVMKKKDVDKKYYKYFDGRPNIFTLFIIKSLNLLNKNGIISFILPKNFLNCLYYDKTRKYIYKNYKILNIIECNDKYIETQQSTILLIIQNKLPSKNTNDLYTIPISEYTIFGTKSNIQTLTQLYQKSKTLFDLGFNVSVGNIVWNQCKKELTTDKTKTHLIYSSDITDNKLLFKSYSNKDKKNYITRQGFNEPLLVINRGYGVGSYNFNYCIINERENISYLIENHLICIKYSKNISKSELIKKYKQIINSFKNKKTSEFIDVYFGNNAINTTELCKILPIYDI